jgi:hypothetical protein
MTHFTNVFTADTSCESAAFPPDYAAFQAARRRFFDRLAADAALRRAARDATRREQALDGEGLLTLEGPLTVLMAERRLVLGYYAPGQRDVADAVRESLGVQDEAFGVGRVGPVRITIQRVPGDAM